ncbi:MAG: hypothetical protein OXG81_00555 [Acidobacteria bacterium]|nr:hypothetical protein [Acidobacteriota bacterium]
MTPLRAKPTAAGHLAEPDDRSLGARTFWSASEEHSRRPQAGDLALLLALQSARARRPHPLRRLGLTDLRPRRRGGRASHRRHRGGRRQRLLD